MEKSHHQGDDKNRYQTTQTRASKSPNNRANSDLRQDLRQPVTRNVEKEVYDVL
jgi:hypothetical protein